MPAREQPVYYSDGIAPVRRGSRDELFHIIIVATPEPEAADYGVAGGAFVNCWVDADDLRAAERRAVALIHQAGWRPQRFDEWSIVTREKYVDCKADREEEPDLCKFVEQAFTDGEVCIFNIWPVDAPDAEAGA
jgi:hypothetical protein